MRTFTKLVFVVLVVALLVAMPSVAFADKKVKDPAPAAEKTPPGQAKKEIAPPGQAKKEAEPTKETKKADEPQAAPGYTPTPEPTSVPEFDANKGRAWVMRCESNGHNPKACTGVIAYRSNDPRNAGKTVHWRFEPHGGPNAAAYGDSGSFVLDEMGNGDARFDLPEGMSKLYAKVEGSEGGEKHKVVSCKPVAPPEETPPPPDEPDAPAGPYNPPSDEPTPEPEPETRRVCWHSPNSAVEVWSDLGFFLDEGHIIGEAKDVYCWDIEIGDTDYVLAWNEDEGHDGPQYSITVVQPGDTVHVYNPFNGVVVLDGVIAVRLNPTLEKALSID